MRQRYQEGKCGEEDIGSHERKFAILSTLIVSFSLAIRREDVTDYYIIVVC